MFFYSCHKGSKTYIINSDLCAYTYQTNSIGEDQQNTIGNNQETNVGEKISIIATDMEETYSDNADTTIGEKHTMTAGESDYFTVKGNMVIKASGKALVQGDKDARVSKSNDE